MIFPFLKRFLKKETYSASDEHFKSIVEQSPFSIQVYDVQGKVIKVNKAFEKLWGVTLEDMRGYSILKDEQLRQKGLMPYIEKGFSGELASMPPTEYDAKGTVYKGDKRWVRATIYPVKSDQGKLLNVILVHEDITEQKLAENALLESERRVRALLDLSPGFIGLQDPSGIVLDANKSSLAFIGAKAEEVLGKPFWETPWWRHSKEMQTKLQEALRKAAEGELVRFETTQSSADGSIHTIDLTLKPLFDEKGEVNLIIAHGWDITDLKLAEAERMSLENQVQHAQRLESLGILAAGIAHDFNNLLSAIFGNIEMAQRYAESGLNQKVTTALGKITGAIERARELTNQILTFSKGGAPKKETTDIVPLLKQSAMLSLGGSNIVADLQIANGLWSCDIDKNQIAQVVDNLILNAKESMPQGGKVTVRAENIDERTTLPKLLSPGRYVKVTVKDSGAGIAPEHLAKIFDPFFTTKPKGTGLGLSIAYSIISKHCGVIEAESEVGKGAAFSIFLPASPKPSLLASGPRTASISGQGRILAMDDEPDVLDLLSAMLSEMGYQVDIASNGEQAIQLYKQAIEKSETYSAVILDLTVRGGMGGKETIGLLKEIDPNVRAIVSSGYANDPIVSDPTSSGFKATLPKPYRFVELATVLQRVLGEK